MPLINCKDKIFCSEELSDEVLRGKIFKNKMINTNINQRACNYSSIMK